MNKTIQFKSAIYSVLFLTLMMTQVFSQAPTYTFSDEGMIAIDNAAFDLEMGDFIQGGRNEFFISHQTSYGNPGKLSFLKYNTGTNSWELTSIDTNMSPKALVAGDFDSDGNLDLVHTDYCNCSSHRLYNGDGAGNFTEATTFSGNRFSEDAVFVDFNNDNKMDIITGGNSLTNIYTNTSTGTGNFGFSKSGFNISDPWNSTSGFAVADFDKDGWDDFVQTKPGNGEILVSLNSGSGTFSIGTAYAVTGISSSDSVRGVAVGDFNQDGYMDIVATENDQDKIGVFLNDGDGTFGAVSLLDITTPNFVEVADMNQDNKPDIVVATSTGFAIFENLGSGIFNTIPYQRAVSGISRHLEVGDVDSDGKIDVIYAANNQFVVALNQGTLAVEGEGSLADDQIALYPNPAKDKLYVKVLNSGFQAYQFEIVNAVGQSVAVVQSNDGLFDVSGFSSGVYFMNIKKDQVVLAVKKFVKN